ncbi:MAG: 3'-5' exonuclease domain-containing protein 2 [Cyclobacteriaceae bacterium]
MMYPESITKQEISTFPLLKFDGEIEVIDQVKDIKRAVSYLSKFEKLGFDTEKKPAFRKGVYNYTSLVQLSTTDKAFLFRIKQTGFHPALVDLLSSKRVSKIGISLRDDIIDLQNIESFEPGGIVDLNKVAQDLGFKNSGVRNLTGIILNKRVSKNQQTSNWENEELTPGQMQYASLDAWVCLEIYNELERKGYIYENNGQVSKSITKKMNSTKN